MASTWNYRIIARDYKGDVDYGVYEVFYSNGEPDGHIENPIQPTFESIEGLNWFREKLKEALEKPVLSYANFPKEYKEK